MNSIWTHIAILAISWHCVLSSPVSAAEVLLRYDSRGNLIRINSDQSPTEVFSVLPGFGVPGDVVKISGQGFSSALGSNAVSFAAMDAQLTQASDSLLVVTVPAGASTGPITVTSPGGTAASPNHFIVLPSAVPGNMVSSATTMQVDGPDKDVNALSNRHAAVSFTLGEGVAASFHLLTLEAANANGAQYKIFGPDNLQVATGQVSNVARSIHLPVPAVAGTYTLYLTSTGWLRTRLKLESDPLLVVDGASTEVTTSFRGQSRRVQFHATVGQNLGYAVTDFVGQPSGSYIQYTTLYRPSGSQLNAWTNLPETGTYTVLLKMTAATAQTSMNLWLSSELTGALPLNASTTVSAPRPGQGARYTFDGSQGQQLSVATSNTSTAPSNQRVAIYFYKPDGSCLFSGCYYSATQAIQVNDLPVLPVTGTYTVLFDVNPYDNANASFSTDIVLSEYLAETLEVDGPPVTATTTLLGQRIRATFQGIAGQNLGFAITQLVSQPTANYVQYTTLYRPSGPQLNSWTNLPETGTYTVILKMTAATVQSSMDLWLSSETVGVLPLNATTTVPASRPGQGARYTFDGTQGQQLTVATSNTSTTPANQRVAIYYYKPDGSCLVSGCYFNATQAINVNDLPALPVSGTYTVFFDINPYDNANASFTTDLTVSEDVLETLIVDGPAVPAVTTLLGQKIRMSFAGTAGQNLGLGIRDFVGTPAGSYLQYRYLYKPDGGALGSWSNLPESGSYTVILKMTPGTTQSGLNAWLSSEATGTLALGAGTVVSARPGQAARYTFEGVVGQELRLTAEATTTDPSSQRLTVTILNPNGTCAIPGCSFTALSTGMTFADIPTLASAGTYTVLVDISVYDNADAAFSTTLTVAPR